MALWVKLEWQGEARQIVAGKRGHVLLSAASLAISDKVPTLHLAQLFQAWEHLAGSRWVMILLKEGTDLLF